VSTSSPKQYPILYDRDWWWLVWEIVFVVFQPSYEQGELNRHSNQNNQPLKIRLLLLLIIAAYYYCLLLLEICPPLKNHPNSPTAL
jgi:hypothetical protein